MEDLIFSVFFGSEIRIKIIRFFLLQAEGNFDLGLIRKRLQIKNVKPLKRELKKLRSIGFLKAKGKKISLNPAFPMNGLLRSFILTPSFWYKEQMIKKFQKLGAIKLLILTGILTGDDKMPEADLLLVGNKIKEKKLANLVNELEADFGKELNYLVLSEKDFQYRYSMMDRLIREILESEKNVLIDKLGLEKMKTI
ncbi:MAG TPA: hypothetical protein PKZ02_00545 [Candidatus Paceibacterota bacterium]|nr:hypothetical protein [Candidatus Paceibacterota bacterium]